MSNEGLRVLVVEDDLNLAQAVADLLGDHGFQVEQRHDGESGYNAAQEHQYDLIVLDLMLPKRNGFTVCNDLRQSGNFTPLLMLTAKDGELDEVEGLDVGADDFLRKPFENSVLIARIQALLRRQQRGRPQDLVCGHVRIDRMLRKVTANGSEVSLTPREFALLNYLMASEGSPVSKAEILKEVWGADFDGDPNIVEVYIGYLRKKIDIANKASIIQTLRGQGYVVSSSE